MGGGILLASPEVKVTPCGSWVQDEDLFAGGGVKFSRDGEKTFVCRNVCPASKLGDKITFFRVTGARAKAQTQTQAQAFTETQAQTKALPQAQT